MDRLAILVAVLAFISFCHTSPHQSVDTVVVGDGRIGIGRITGGNFAPESFSIGGSPSGRPKTSIVVNDDHIIIQTPTSNEEQQANYQTSQNGGGNTQLYPVKHHQKTHISQGQGDIGDEGSSGGAQMEIGAVVLSNNKHNKDNNNKNSNKQPATMKAAGVAVESNDSNNNFPSAENGFTISGEQGSIQIGSISEGNFGKGNLNVNYNKTPATSASQKETGNDGNSGNLNASNETQHSQDYGGNNNTADNKGVGSSQTDSGQISGTSEEPWIWNR